MSFAGGKRTVYTAGGNIERGSTLDLSEGCSADGAGDD